jgi:hypothetical protein
VRLNADIACIKMALHRNYTNLLTGESRGEFDALSVKSNGSMQNILTLIGAGSGGGATGITEVTGSGLVVIGTSGTARHVSIDLSSYATTAVLANDISNALSVYSDTSQVSAAITSALIDYATSATLTASLAGKINTSHECSKIGGDDVDLGAHGLTSREMTFTSNVGPALTLKNDDTGKLTIVGANSASGGVVTVPILADELAIYTTTAALTPLLSAKAAVTTVDTALALKQDILTATLPIVLTGNVISSLWKPSALQGGVGLSGLWSDTLGTFLMSLDGSESRYALKLKDPNVVVRDLSANLAGKLVWDGEPVATETWSSTQLDTKADSSDVTIGFNAVTQELTYKEVTLQYYDEVSDVEILIAQYFDDDPTNPTYVPWYSGRSDNYTGFQTITLEGGAGVWKAWSDLGVGTVHIHVF